jgi:hypothetical protein
VADDTTASKRRRNEMFYRHPIKKRAAEMAATLEHHWSIEIGDAPF